MDAEPPAPSPTAGGVRLPLDVLRLICSFADQPTLLDGCRLASRDLGSLATWFAFRSIRLEAYWGALGAQRFVNIATSPTLRPLVREVTCDSWMGVVVNGDDERTNRNRLGNPPHEFLNALPYLQYFLNLTALHIRFTELCGYDNVPISRLRDTNETYDFRYRVLDTIFNCLAGTWSPQKQVQVDARLSVPNLRANPTLWPQESPSRPLPVQTLTVSNLADFDDARLTSSDAFRSVMGEGSIRDLRLYMLLAPDYMARRCAKRLRDKYAMFKTLHQTWLSPNLADNLQVLSLYAHDNWGWNPRMDFRTVNATASSPGFPNLRVLALGRYMFSHDWQVDWIASLGKNIGGLQELYLDGCFILAYAEGVPPLDDSTTSLGRDHAGRHLDISNKGYPRESMMIEQMALLGVGEEPHWDAETFETPPSSFRWHHILRRWQATMRGLRVLSMGIHMPLLVKSSKRVFGVYDDDDGLDSNNPRIYRLWHNAFRTFDCPSAAGPMRQDMTGRITEESFQKYRFGTGLVGRNRWLNYARFRMGLDAAWPWTLIVHWHGADPRMDKTLVATDREAMDDLQDLLARRIAGEDV